MKLYMHVAACSLSPHIVCQELDLPVELVEVDRATHHTNAGDDFLAINGNGYVPVLELDDGQRLFEGAAIVQYLADLRPEAGLIAAPGTMARSHTQGWLNFISAELHKPMAMLMQPAFKPVHPVLLTLVGKRLDWLTGQLTQPYLGGQAFSVADAYLFVCLNWSNWNGIDLARWPKLEDFMTRVAARPKVQEALTAEGLGRPEASSLFFAPQRPAQVTPRGAKK